MFPVVFRVVFPLGPVWPRNGQNEEVNELPEGFAAGHWTSEDGSTGCTVVLPPAGNVSGVDVRGNAPGSREHALSGAIEVGRIGAGAGATVGKWAGIEHRVTGGLGFGRASMDGYGVAAIAVVKAFGDVIARNGSVLAIVMTRARLSKAEATFVAARGSDGITVAYTLRRRCRVRGCVTGRCCSRRSLCAGPYLHSCDRGGCRRGARRRLVIKRHFR